MMSRQVPIWLQAPNLSSSRFLTIVCKGCFKKKCEKNKQKKGSHAVALSCHERSARKHSRVPSRQYRIFMAKFILCYFQKIDPNARACRAPIFRDRKVLLRDYFTKERVQTTGWICHVGAKLTVY